MSYTINKQHVSSGLVSALMTCTGGAILIIQSAQNFGLSEKQLISWLIICYCAAGLFNLFLALYYKIPIAGAHSVTSVAFLSSAAIEMSYSQLTGAFLLSGLIVALFGFTGVFHFIFRFIPRPVIDAMLAGIILHYVLQIIPAFAEQAIVAGLSLIGYIIFQKRVKTVPPIIGVLIFGIGGLLFTYSFPAISSLPFSMPQLVKPEVTWQGAISIALPLAVLVLSNDLAVSLASLSNNGYKPKINQLISYSGIATVLGSFFGAHSINIGGMMTTLCSSEDAGEHHKRYMAGVVSSVLCIVFGLLSWKLVPYISALPSYFIAMIIGYSLLGIFINSMKNAYSNHQYRFSVSFAFIISAANYSFFGISSALWSLIGGALISFLLKENDQK